MGSCRGLCYTFLFLCAFQLFSSEEKAPPFYCSILPCLEGKSWFWLKLTYSSLFDTCTFHNRTINLVVWLDSNKPSFSTVSYECHIFPSFLAHPVLQHFDSYPLPPLTQNSCSLHIIPLLTNEEEHSNFWHSCRHRCCSKVLLAAIQISFHKSRCFGFFPPCTSIRGLFILFLVWSRALNGSTQSCYKALREFLGW